MGVLDDFFLGRNRERKQLANSRLEDIRNAKVIALGDKGALIETADRRASSQGAAVAMLRTTGSIPEGFFVTASRQSLVPFAQDSGNETAKALRDNGAGLGSTVSDLNRVINGSAANGSQSLKEEMLRLLNESGQSETNTTSMSRPTSSRVGLADANPKNTDYNALNEFLSNIGSTRNGGSLF